MTHLEHADALDGWLPVRGETTVGTAQLQVARAPAGRIALRNSADPTGPALLVPHSAVRDFSEAIRTGAIDAVLTRAPTDHPSWCTGTESPEQRHRSSVLLAHHPDDLTEVRVWIVQLFDAEPELVMISVEEADADRKRLVLTSQRVSNFIAVTEQLEGLAADVVPHLCPDGRLHPRWCLGLDNEPSGMRHRSVRLSISLHGDSEDSDVETIDLQLIQNNDHQGHPDIPARVLLRTQDEDERTSWFLELHQLPLIRQALTEVTQWRAQGADQGDRS